MMQREFRLTGRHVLLVLIGFFVVIIAANAVFMSFALRTFPGEKEEKSYLQGLNYNDRLHARAEQAKLGWTASISEVSFEHGLASIRLTMNDRSGLPLSGLEITGMLLRPAADEQDTDFVFEPRGEGDYAGAVSAGQGQWEMAGVATDDNGNQFEFATRLILE